MRARKIFRRLLSKAAIIAQGQIYCIQHVFGPPDHHHITAQHLGPKSIQHRFNTFPTLFNSAPASRIRSGYLLFQFFDSSLVRHSVHFSWCFEFWFGFLIWFGIWIGFVHVVPKRKIYGAGLTKWSGFRRCSWKNGVVSARSVFVVE